MATRIEQELELLRQYYPELEVNGQWIKLPNFSIPQEQPWNRKTMDICILIPDGYPGAQPYGIYVPVGIRCNGVKPTSYTEPVQKQPPFLENGPYSHGPQMERGSPRLTFAKVRTYLTLYIRFQIDFRRCVMLLPTILSFPTGIFEEIRGHLLPKNVKAEEAAMIFATVKRSDGLLELIYKDWYPIPPEGFEYQSMGHIELEDTTRAKVIKMAHDLDAALIEFHSHPHPYDACFSWSDRSGFEEFVPHVWWRLKGKPYAAVVVAPSNVDALVWVNSPTEPQAIGKIYAGDEIITPTNLTLKHMKEGGDYGTF